MSIFDRVMGRKPDASMTPGLEATTAVDEVDEDPYGLLPDMSESDYSSLTGFAPSPNATAYEQAQIPTVYGADERGPAMRQEDAAAVGGKGGEIARMAKAFAGTPYVWGGSTPSGFDCSGFVQYVYRKMGINLPRVSFQQARAGKRVGLGALRSGDLVAWDNSSRNNGADHIAIYLGGGLIAEAPRAGVPLRVRKLGKNENAWGVRVL